MRRLCGGRSFLLSGLVVVGLPATAAPAPAPVQAQRWVLSGSVRETLTDNLFLVAPDGPGEAITAGTLGVTYSRVGEKYSLSALGWANGQIFSRYGAYNGATYGLGAYGQRDFTRDLRGRLGLSYADGLNLSALYSSRVGIPQLDIKTGYLDTGLTYKLSPGTSLTGSFDATGIKYRSEVLLSTARLPADSLTPPDVQVPLSQAPTPDVPQAPDASLQALDILALQSLRVYRLDYWTWHAGIDVSHELSPTTRMTGDLGYLRTGQEPRTFAAGDQIEARAGLQHTIHKGAILFFNYDYQDNRFGAPLQTHSLVGGLTRDLTAKVRFDVSLGGSFLDGATAAASGWSAIGGAGVSMRFDRAQLAARYERSRYQALVLGRNQTVDLVFASFGRVVTRRLYLAAYGSYRNARDPVSDLYSYTSTSAGAFLTARIKKRGGVGLNYSYQRFGTRGFPAADRSLLTFFLSYARTEK